MEGQLELGFLHLLLLSPTWECLVLTPAYSMGLSL